MSITISPAGPPSSSLSSSTRGATFHGIKLQALLILGSVVFFMLLIIIVLLAVIIRLCRKKRASINPVSTTQEITQWECHRCSSSLNAKLLPSLKPDYVPIPKQTTPAFLLPSELQGSNSLSELQPQFNLQRDGWRVRRFSFKEIEVATRGFSNDNITCFEDGDVTYVGFLPDTIRVAVKIISARYMSDEVEAEVELLGHARHKNLAIVIGVCMEGGFRMVVSEYADNSTLHGWLHNCREEISPLSWDIRMNIIQGVAKGLTYLHEDLEPRIVHKALRSSNVLLDRYWTPKLSDFGFSKLYGYHEGNLWSDDLSDIYQFGELVLETVSGKLIVDESQPQRYLIDWVKSMIMDQRIMEVVDPKMGEIPSSKDLKRIVLLALRCVDVKKINRPTMAEIIHMLEPRDLLIDDVRISVEDGTRSSECIP